MLLFLDIDRNTTIIATDLALLLAVFCHNLFLSDSIARFGDVVIRFWRTLKQSLHRYVIRSCWTTLIALRTTTGTLHIAAHYFSLITNSPRLVFSRDLSGNKVVRLIEVYFLCDEKLPHRRG